MISATLTSKRLLDRNRGSGRGVAFLNDHSSNTEIVFCIFEENQSSSLGGSIFNRGKLEVSYSTFQGNEGDVSSSKVYSHTITMFCSMYFWNEIGRLNCCLPK